MELEKNVPNTDLKDIQRALNCTDARVKAVADTVKNLELRMGYFEEGMSVFRNLTKEISNLKEFFLTLAKETMEKNTYDTLTKMYKRQHTRDYGLLPLERGMVAVNVEEIYQDMDSYTKWLKWKKMQEENGGRLYWSKWIETKGPDKKNNDTCYLLRE